jgi:hypothetical protein
MRSKSLQKRNPLGAHHALFGVCNPPYRVICILFLVTKYSEKG